VNLLLRHLLNGWRWTGEQPIWAAGTWYVPLEPRRVAYLSMAPGEYDWSRTFTL
jgi:hypothetical protein